MIRHTYDRYDTNSLVYFLLNHRVYIERQIDRHTDKRMEEWMDGRTYVCNDGLWDGRTDRQTDRQMDGWMNGWMDEWMDGWMDGWID